VKGESAGPASNRIFISYRREETAYAAGWLFDRLVERFGRPQIFKDVDSIALGDDFVETISNAVGKTDVLLALIGEQWLTMRDEKGARRLENPDDFVRIELEAALERKIRVIPILVDGAAMPTRNELPQTLAPLAQRQALELSPSRFDFDTRRLMNVLEHTLAEDDGADDRGPLPTEKAPTPTPRARDDSIARPPELRRGVNGSPSLARRWVPRPGTRRTVVVATVAGLIAVAAVVALVFTKPFASADKSQGSGGPGGSSFQDDFSTRTYGWRGGSYREGSYQVMAERSDRAVHASPRNGSSDQNIRISVDAHRTGGTAEVQYGYGLFCRGNGQTSSYVFNVWTGHAGIAKRSSGEVVNLAPLNNEIGAAITGDPVKSLEAECITRMVNGRTVVDLRFVIDDKIVLQGTDPDTCPDSVPCGPPLLGGEYGVRAALGGKGGPDDTLEVTFDNFEFREMNE
jgi:TIR domain